MNGTPFFQLPGRTHKSKKFSLQVFWIPGFALPYGQDGPSQRLQLRFLVRISFCIGFELGEPIIGFGFRRLAVPTSMGMPKAAVKEDSFSSAGKNEVRLSG